MVALQDLMSFLSTETTSLIQVSVFCNLFSPSHIPWFQFLLRNLWEGWRIFPLSLCMLSQLHTREGPGRDTNTLVLLPKLSCLPPAGPPSLCLEPYSSHNEVCRVNSHSAGHRDEDSIPLMSPPSCPSQQRQGQGFSWLADTWVLAPSKSVGEGFRSWLPSPGLKDSEGSIAWAASIFLPSHWFIHPSAWPSLFEITFQHKTGPATLACSPLG